MAKVLFITSNRIGDAVLSSGVLAHLVDTMPDARFTIAAGPLAAPLFKGVPRLDQIIVHAKRKYGAHWLKLWTQTVNAVWDLVVDLRGSRTSWFLSAKHRAISGRPRFDLHKVEEAALVLDLVPAPSPRIWLTEEARRVAHNRLLGAHGFLALSPAASSPFKEWAPERFAAVARTLTANEEGRASGLSRRPVYVFGGPGDEAKAKAVMDALPDRRTVDFTGQLPIDVTAACLERAGLFVGNDSGLMHIAAALDTPTLGVFGPTDERVYGPWGERAAAVRAGAAADATAREQLRHAEHSMMDELDVDCVFEAARALLGRNEDARHAAIF